MKKIIALLIALSWCNLLIGGADATQLLGSWNNAGASGGGVGAGTPQGQFSPPQMYFTFGYGTGWAVDDPAIRTPYFPSGTTGTFDYNSSNNAYFSAFVQHLTNASDEILWSISHVYEKTGTPLGGGGGNLESYLFPPFASLASWQPEFVRLIINSLNVQEFYSPPDLPVWAGGWGYEYSSNIDWQIWGEMGSSSVPEPSTMLLLGSGLLGLIGVGRKFRK